ncbi:hypothetical protein R9X47_01345 [Wukongibacter baidiensis]|uniref:hypothetical protein n=1 Tax=Wukongibacter baidiensis TaxID=1723361 RepID=UPI003D7F19B2
MKKIYCLILLIFVSTSLLSCTKQFELSETDINYIFLPEDISELDLSDYRVKPLKNNKDYFFTKSSNDLGFYSLYHIYFVNSQDNEFDVQTNLSIQNDEQNANELFKTLAKHFKDAIELDPTEYNSDKVLLKVDENSFDILLKKSNLVYEVNISGANISIAQVKTGLLNKINYISNNKID